MKFDQVVSMLEAVPVGLCVTELDGSFIIVNEYIIRMMGYSREEFQHIHSGDFYNDIHDRERMVERFRRGETILDFMTVFKRKNGETFDVKMSNSHFSVEGRDTILTAIEDITERKRKDDELRNAYARLQETTMQLRASDQQLRASNQQLVAGEQQLRAANQQLQANEQQLRAANQQLRANEQQLRAANQQLHAKEQELKNKLQELELMQSMLVQSEKLSGLGRMAADMAHEINNPMMVISGNAQLCLMEDIQNPEVRAYLEIIVAEIGRAKDIIQRLLRFARPSKGEMGRVELPVCIEGVINLIEYQFSLDNVVIRRESGENIPAVRADEKQLQEVFLNLFTNAREAMPGGGVVTVALLAENGRARVEISDTGCGMSAGDLKKLFEPFFTTKEKGNGLGLPISYGIVQNMGGEIRFESKLGKGTKAILSFPAYDK